jgi:uncharacterized protein YbaR (Trm112 family)
MNLICPKCKEEMSWVTTEETEQVAYNLYSCFDCKIEVIEYLNEK